MAERDDLTEQLLGLAERLYGLPLAEFTPARDALVKQHRRKYRGGCLYYGQSAH